ncbi:MAG: YncE family protein [Hyphomicrobiaceae bacterium]|nr:YncE family protein [Hyphomicrobiaceae bacterium]
MGWRWLRYAAGAVAALWPAVALAAPVSPSYRYAYITNQGSETLSIIDLDAWTVVAEVKITGRPAGIALSPDHRQAYVTAPEGRDVVVVDTATRMIVGRLAAGDGPLGIAVLPNGRLLVADWYATHVAIIDPDTGATVTKLPSGASPSGVAASGDGQTVVSADRDSNQISITRLGAADGVGAPITDVVPVGTRPFGVTMNAPATRAYTANVGSNDVTVVDLTHSKVIASIPVGRRPYAIALSEKHGFSTDQYGGTITVFDLETNAVVSTVEACDHPEGIAFDPGRRMMYVACWGDNVLLRLSSDTFKVAGRVAVGDGPRAFGDFLGR